MLSQLPGQSLGAGDARGPVAAARPAVEPAHTAVEPGVRPASTGQVAHHASNEESPAAQIAFLQEQLQAKEQLVVALTDRLEQAAEQLDRVRRTGGDRALRRTSGGMPAELVEEQRSAIEELKQSLARWEEMQAGLTLGRLETQIAELRDLVANNLQGGSAGRDVPAAASPRSKDREQGGGVSWWEQQKAALLGGTAPPEPSSTHDPRATLTDIKYEGEKGTVAGELQIPDLPPPLDLENLVLEEARHALRERDNIITQLREQLLLLQAQENFSGHDLNSPDLPTGLRERLELLEQQWQSKFRQIELDLSIERARYSRDEANLQSRQELIEKEMMRLGLHGHDARSPRGEVEDVPRRRWFNFLNSDSEANNH